MHVHKAAHPSGLQVREVRNAHDAMLLDLRASGQINGDHNDRCWISVKTLLGHVARNLREIRVSSTAIYVPENRICDRGRQNAVAIG